MRNSGLMLVGLLVSQAAFAAHDTGTYDEGWAFGEKNAGAIARNVEAKTVDRYGCTALPRLEGAFLAVVRKLQVPSWEKREGGDFALGYLDGYVERIQDALWENRDWCGVGAYDDGSYAGLFAGAVICRAASIDVDLVGELKLDGPYAGWSGGESARSEECALAAKGEIEACVGEGVSAGFEGALGLTCSDSVTE